MYTRGVRTGGLLLSLCLAGCATTRAAGGSPRLEPTGDEAAVEAAAARMPMSPNAPAAHCENLGMIVGIKSYTVWVEEQDFQEAAKEAQLKAAKRGATYLQLQPPIVSTKPNPQVIIVGTAYRCPGEAPAATTPASPVTTGQGVR